MRSLHLHLGVEQFAELPLALGVLGMYWAHVIAFARLVRQWCLRTRSPVDQSICLTTGFALLGFYIWGVGYLRVLNAPFFACSAVAWYIVASVVARKGVVGAAGERRAVWAGLPGGFDALAALAALTLLIAIVSGLRDGAFDDDYKWQSATAWVRAGRWVRVPYRLTNGTALSEMLYVPAATLGCLTAAHWVNTSLWACAAMNAAALGTPLGLSVPVAIVALLSLPVFTTSASTLNSDVPALAFALAALAALVQSRSAPRRRPALLVAGLLFAAVLSTKFIVLACLPAALVGLLVEGHAPLGTRAKRAAVVVAPVVGVVILWMAHTAHLTGHAFDPSGKHLATSPTDPMWVDGQAAGRIPHLHDLLRLPVEPFMTTVLGQAEPYGRRTGLLWLALLPASAALVASRRVPWRPPVALTALAVSFYLLLAPFVLKTRFLMLFFACMALVSAAAYEHRRLFRRPAATAIAVVFLVTAVVGTADGVRRLLFNVVLDTPPAPAQPPPVI